MELFYQYLWWWKPSSSFFFASNLLLWNYLYQYLWSWKPSSFCKSLLRNLLLQWQNRISGVPYSEGLALCKEWLLDLPLRNDIDGSNLPSRKFYGRAGSYTHPEGTYKKFPLEEPIIWKPAVCMCTKVTLHEIIEAHTAGPSCTAAFHKSKRATP